MEILHPRPTKSGSTTGVQNRTENAGVPKGWKVTSFQNWICKHLQKGNQAIFTGPGQPAHPGRQWPPRGPPPNTGSSHSPCEVSIFQQVPCRPSGPSLQTFWTDSLALPSAHSVQEKGHHWFLTLHHGCEPAQKFPFRPGGFLSAVVTLPSLRHP